MNAPSAKPLDLPTRLELGFEELTRQELKDMMSQRGLKKRTHKILKFVQTVDHKKTFRYQILTLLPEPDPRRATAHSPPHNAFDFTFDRSKSLHSTEQKKLDASFDHRKEASGDLRRLPALAGLGQTLLEASKRDLVSAKAHKARIAKTVTQMKISRAQNKPGHEDPLTLFAVRHVVDLSGPDPREQLRPLANSSSAAPVRKSTSPPAARNPKLTGAQLAKLELQQLAAERPAKGESEERGESQEEEQSSWELRRALDSEPQICAKTLEHVRTTVESISRVFGVERAAVIELWLKCESSKLVVKKLALDLALN